MWDQVSGCCAFPSIGLCSVVSDSCNPMDCSPPDSSVHVILQARILEWGAICYSRQSSRPRDWTRVFCVSCIDGEILYHWATFEALACFSRSVNQSVFSSLKSRGCAKQPLRHHPVWASWNLKPKEACGCWVFTVYTGCHTAWVHGVSRATSSSWQSSSLDETALFPCYSGQRGSWHFFPCKESLYFSVLSLDTQQEKLPYSSWWACEAAILSEAQKSTDSPLGQDLRDLEKRWREAVKT